MRQWSANCGTSVSATCRSVMLSSSDPDSCSPMRSSRAIRSRSRRLLRRVASRAMITMPSIDPDGLRSGMAWARTNTRDPSGPHDAENVPSPVRPRKHLLGQLGHFPGVAAGEPEGQDRLPEKLARSREAEQCHGERICVQQVAIPVGDHHGGRHLAENCLRREVRLVPAVAAQSVTGGPPPVPHPASDRTAAAHLPATFSGG